MDSEYGPGIPQIGTPTEVDFLDSEVCERCDGDGLAHGSDRPFEYSGPDSYPGKCPVCKGSGKSA
jgi:DnaJ-class molecular chaperone